MLLFSDEPLTMEEAQNAWLHTLATEHYAMADLVAANCAGNYCTAQANRLASAAVPTPQYDARLEAWLFPEVSYELAYTLEHKTIGSTSAAAGSLSACFPNPANDRLEVVFDLAEGETATLQLVSLTGQVLETAVLSGAAGVQRTAVATAKLPAGSYLLRAQFAGHVEVQRVSVLH